MAGLNNMDVLRAPERKIVLDLVVTCTAKARGMSDRNAASDGPRGRRPTAAGPAGRSAAARRPPRAAAARRRAAAHRPPVFFELGVFSWCGSCRAPRELENTSSLSFQLVRVAENGPRVRFASFPYLPGDDCSGLTQGIFFWFY